MLGMLKTLTLRLSEVDHMTLVLLRKFCETARWKVYDFLRKSGCKEAWIKQGWKYNGWNGMLTGIVQAPNWCGLLQEKGVTMESLDLLRFGSGSLQKLGSEAAHALPEKEGSLESEMDLSCVEVYAKLISEQTADKQKLLNMLFEFCFKSGDYDNFL
ncbi:hypothetical protein L7F22_020035 [Adiantum nelumboides]|nr:hypothetical protein [Adiantum nelumboides]